MRRELREGASNCTYSCGCDFKAQGAGCAWGGGEGGTGADARLVVGVSLVKVAPGVLRDGLAARAAGGTQLQRFVLPQIRQDGALREVWDGQHLLRIGQPRSLGQAQALAVCDSQRELPRVDRRTDEVQARRRVGVIPLGCVGLRAHGSAQRGHLCLQRGSRRAACLGLRCHGRAARLGLCRQLRRHRHAARLDLSHERRERRGHGRAPVGRVVRGGRCRGVVHLGDPQGMESARTRLG